MSIVWYTKFHLTYDCGFQINKQSMWYTFPSARLHEEGTNAAFILCCLRASICLLTVIFTPSLFDTRWLCSTPGHSTIFILTIQVTIGLVLNELVTIGSVEVVQFCRLLYAIWCYTMLQTVEFPTGIAHLHASLTKMD